MMSLRNSIEFMLYTNFGIDFKDGQTDKILDVALDKAYNDATMQGAYNTIKATNKNDVKNEKNIIKEQIKSLLDNKINYDEFHNRICRNLVEKYEYIKIEGKDESAFTYGNAQKWINMTMKYLYILSEVYHEYNPKCEFDMYFDGIKNLYKDLQVPVDSYIIESLWNDTEIDLPIATKKNFREEEYKDNRAKSWSKWDESEYKKFRDSFRKNKDDITPIDWEHKAWIEIAKKRKTE